MSSHPEVFTGGVLRVTVHHVYYPVTEETLQQVFAAYGVVKISVSQRIDHVEAVVQLRSRRGAAQALTLHGRCIYERACHLNIQDVSPEYNLYWCLLLELKQTATVTEYTAAFWEHVHHVLDLNPNLSIKCFVPQYIEGLREDIQPAVQSQSPSSITRASSIARIKEEEIRKDAAMGAEELGDGYDHGVHGLMPSETLSNVSPELAAPVLCGADRGIDASSLAAPTPPTCSTECLSRNATVIDPNSVAIDALSQKMDRLLCMMDKGIARMSSAHEAVVYATRSSSVAASPTTPAYSTPMAIDVPETHVVIGKMPEQNLVILWPPWRRNAFSPGHSAIHSDQLLLANIQSRRRSGFSLGKYGIGGAQHVVDKLPSWRRNAFSPRNSVMQGSPEMWFSFFSQFHMKHFSASKWDPGNRLQFLLLITIYHFLRLEDLACWSAQFSTSWCHMWAWLYRLFSAPDQHTCFSSSPVYMVHSGSSCMCAGAKEQWKALYCVQNWCLCRMECSQQHILDWKIYNPCPTGFYTRTQFQWTLRDMLPFGKPAMEVNYACVSTIPEWFTCSVGLLDSKLPVFSFLWVMHCTQLHNFSIASLCSQSWYSCCYKKIQIAVIATVCLVLECPKLIAAACYMKVLSWTWTRCEHNLRHLIRNGVEGIDHVGHERQRTHLTGQWDSFFVVVHWNHQEDGSECYFHLQSRLLGLIVQQLCNMSSLEGMSWDPGGIHGSGI